MSKQFKKHLVSASVTFLSVFSLAIVAVPDIHMLDNSAMVALLVASVRAGVKAVAELLPSWITE